MDQKIKLSCLMAWFVYYGPHLSHSDLKKVDIAILEPDHITPKNFSKTKTIFFGYLSVGEVNTSRPYWEGIRHKSFVKEENPVWKGSMRVDIRSAEWQALLLEKLIPEIMAKGYQGLFLDTLDEAAAPSPESKEAVIRFVKKIKERFPDILIIVNNGLDFLDRYGDAVYGVAVEDFYTHYDFEKKKSVAAPEKVDQFIEGVLDPFKAKYHKEVFVILYETSPQAPLARKSIAQCEKKGYQWYLAPIGLTSIGTISIGTIHP